MLAPGHLSPMSPQKKKQMVAPWQLPEDTSSFFWHMIEHDSSNLFLLHLLDTGQNGALLHLGESNTAVKATSPLSCVDQQGIPCQLSFLCMSTSCSGIKAQGLRHLLDFV